MTENETHSLDTKCEVCGGTREVMAIRHTLFYNVSKRVRLFLFVSGCHLRTPYPQTRRPYRPPPPCTTPFRARASRSDSRFLTAAGHAKCC